MRSRLEKDARLGEPQSLRLVARKVFAPGGAWPARRPAKATTAERIAALEVANIVAPSKARATDPFPVACLSRVRPYDTRPSRAL